MFKHAIVRKLSKNFENGITTSNLGKSYYNIATIQHANYVDALKECGLDVCVLEEDDQFPDSTFVEDTAIVNREFAVIANPGAISRKGEEVEVKNTLIKYYNKIESIKSPGTVEGGDVLKAEDHYYIGLSRRTNNEGAKQLKRILKEYGYNCTIIPLKKVLHLKTGVSYIGDNNLIVAGEFIDNPDFKEFNRIEVDTDENYAANSLRVNDYVLMPKGYTELYKLISRLGYKIIELEMSEFRKMDGGLSCLSLRF
jgi:dimethylargininase